MENLAVENFNKFISLVARRVNKSEWHTFPLRTKNVFYNNKDIDRWIVRASDVDKMFFLEDLGFTTARVVFPNNNFDISDIPELSEYSFTIKNKISSVEKQLEKNLFCLCTREVGTFFYNMSQNSNSQYFALKQDFLALTEANKSEKKTYASALEYEKNRNAREGILKLIMNLLIDLNANHGDRCHEEITILFHLREFNETGVKSETVLNIFKGSIGKRMIQNYIANLVKQGYINRSGRKSDTIYMLSAKGMIFINDFANRIMSL